LPAKKALKLDLPEIVAASKALAPAVKRLSKLLSKLDPKDLPTGARADTLYDLRVLTKLLSNVTAPFDDVLSPAIKALEESFVQELAVGESSGVQGFHARVQVTESVVPVVAAADWPKFYAYVAKTRAWELLSKSVNRAAVTERWDNKKQVPHVGRFHAKKVSCTKLGGKK